MKTWMKASLIIVTLALLACLIWLVSRPGEPDAASLPATPGGMSFEVHVEKPRLGRFLGGILPIRLEEKLFGGSELRFDHTSRDARVGSVGHNRLELRAEGWELLIETDGAGAVAPGTRLVFPILLAERQRTLRCRPAERADGFLHANTRAGSDVLDGRFLVELATCENVETGKVINWPPAPLTVRGSFAGLSQERR